MSADMFTSFDSITLATGPNDLVSSVGDAVLQDRLANTGNYEAIHAETAQVQGVGKAQTSEINAGI